MRFALVTHSLPQPNTNGGPMTCWAIMREMLDTGHGVSVVSLRYPNDPYADQGRQAAVRNQGAALVVLPVDDLPASPAGARGPSARLAVVFPTASLLSRLRSVLEEIAPDAILVYHWDTLAATHGLAIAPRMGVVDDPWHLPNLERWKATRPRPSRSYLQWSLATLRGIRPTTRAMVELLQGCDASGCFQAQAAAWLREKGARGCEYLPASVVDPCGPDWETRRREAQQQALRILLGPSSLGATSTRAGLRLFATRILPKLERELGPDGFEAHIVGDGEPPAELARLLPRRTVKLRGRVEPPDAEFLAADIQLVPTPFVLGKRVRIIVGFAFGCCVVAHSAEAVNLPEIVHGENSLLAPDGEGIARELVRAARDPGLRRSLGAKARRTYEERFHPRTAAARVVDRLVALVTAGRGQPSEAGGPAAVHQ